MALIEWRKEFCTGVAGVDHEHEELINEINEIYAMIDDRADKENVIDKLGDIYGSISAHFALEEQMMEKLSSKGFTVIEVRAAKELMVQPNLGEMALSRNAEEMMNKYQANAIVLGTYKKLGDTVTVHIRMVVADNQEVISVANMQVKIDKDDEFIKSLFDNELDRISLKSDAEGF